MLGFFLRLFCLSNEITKSVQYLAATYNTELSIYLLIVEVVHLACDVSLEAPRSEAQQTARVFDSRTDKLLYAARSAPGALNLMLLAPACWTLEPQWFRFGAVDDC